MRSLPIRCGATRPYDAVLCGSSRFALCDASCVGGLLGGGDGVLGVLCDWLGSLVARMVGVFLPMPLKTKGEPMQRRWITAVLGTVGALVTSVSACSSDSAPGTATDAGGTSDVVAPVVDGASPPDSAPPSNDAAASDAPTIVDGSSCTGQVVKGSVASLFTSQGQPPPLPIAVGWEGCAGTAQAVAGSPFPTWSRAIR